MKVKNKSLQKKKLIGTPFYVKNKKSLKGGSKKTQQSLRKSKNINRNKNKKIKCQKKKLVGSSRSNEDNFKTPRSNHSKLWMNIHDDELKKYLSGSSENRLNTSKLIASTASLSAAGLPRNLAYHTSLEVMKKNIKPKLDEYIYLMNKAIYIPSYLNAKTVAELPFSITCSVDNNIMEKFKRDKENILEIIQLSESDENSNELRKLENFVLNNPLNDGGLLYSVCSFCDRGPAHGVALDYNLDGVTKDADTGIYSADSIKLQCFECAH